MNRNYYEKSPSGPRSGRKDFLFHLLKTLMNRAGKKII